MQAVVATGDLEGYNSSDVTNYNAKQPKERLQCDIIRERLGTSLGTNNFSPKKIKSISFRREKFLGRNLLDALELSRQKAR